MTLNLRLQLSFICKEKRYHEWVVTAVLHLVLPTCCMRIWSSPFCCEFRQCCSSRACKKWEESCRLILFLTTPASMRVGRQAWLEKLCRSVNLPLIPLSLRKGVWEEAAEKPKHNRCLLMLPEFLLNCSRHKASLRSWMSSERWMWDKQPFCLLSLVAWQLMCFARLHSPLEILN